MAFSLEGQTAIVTGAAEGIGRAVAERLANAGATVAVADRNEAGAVAAAGKIGRGAFGLAVNVAERAAVERLIAAALERTGRIDVLVNNAGIGGRAAPVWEQTDEDWDSVLAVNLTSVFYCCRAVIPHMRARRYGRIVNVASVAGKEGNPNMTAYSASKAGVIAFTKSVAKEVAAENICANAVTPAVIRTRILEQLTPAQVDYMVERIPMRRTGTVEEVAAVIHFLASPDASFVTGQCYDVSGGRSTY
ncbi:MAG TPA: SDR family NAD(P)-dependent oxidoreductase [Bryobacterales bacterium]|nr:SDR family NAD(P)-dependent oxidoreductase [Bryobacterales bacterium]